MTDPFSAQALYDYKVPAVTQDLSDRDAMLYALSLGVGRWGSGLHYCYEDQLAVLPMQAVVMGYPGFWIKEAGLGVKWQNILHGEQSVECFASLPAHGRVTGRTRITGLQDRGATGAFLYSERDIEGPEGPVARVSQTTILRAHGGFGETLGRVPTALDAVPDRLPDRRAEDPTGPDAALLYRLNGDGNPLHADPAVARSAGFDRPILHGLCSFGIAGWALLRTLCDAKPDGFGAMRARFSAPAYPGDTLETRIWDDAAGAHFECHAVERGVKVLSHGQFTRRVP